MVELFDKQTGASLGTITDDQLQFLADHLEEESSEDDDYYVNRTTVDFLESEGAAPEVIAILRQALTDREETEIRWERS
jgi:processive 1,2-diacylglycerol beta-glucosyltransferase